MADAEQVERLLASVEAWNAWRADQWEEGIDLDGASLREADLKGANLEWASLDGADLSGADLKGANLEHAKLEGADLNGANLKEAKLTHAQAREADLKETDLKEAKLNWVSLHEANLGGADLAGADLKNAILTDASLVEADLHGADLTGAGLRSADLTGANLGWTRLAGATLTDANLTRANLTGHEWLSFETPEAETPLDGNPISGISISPNSRIPYFKLVAEYTGNRFLILMVLSAAAILTHLVGAAISMYTSADGWREWPRVPNWQIVSGWHEGWLQFTFTVLLVTYNGCRLWVTSSMSTLRHHQEISETAPRLKKYWRYWLLHKYALRWVYYGTLVIVLLKLCRFLFLWRSPAPPIPA